MKPVSRAGLGIAALAVITVSANGFAQGAASPVDTQVPRFLRVALDAPRGSPVLLPGDRAVLSRVIAINLAGVTRASALQAIARLSRANLIYASDVLPDSGRVRVISDSMTVAAAVTEVLTGAGVDVLIDAEENLIVVRKPSGRPTAAAVALPRVRTTAMSGCEDRSFAAEETWDLWEQVRATLLATVATYADRRWKFSVAEVKRVFALDPRQLLHVSLAEETLTADQPWTSFAPAVLAVDGYMVLAGDRLTFIAPDIDVMLSRSFEITHCFLPGVLRDNGLIGLAFEPSRSLRNHVDIAGTFWLDPRSRELRKLSFHHTGLPWTMEEADQESTVEFAKFESDKWFIPAWLIRAPVPEIIGQTTLSLGEQLKAFRDRAYGTGRRGDGWLLSGLNEQRGAVLAVYDTRGTGDTTSVWNAPTGTLRVRVTSGSAAVPAEGARVELLGSLKQRVTDRDGIVEFSRMTAGPYQLQTTVPENAALGEPSITSTSRVDAGRVTTLTVSAPAPRDIIRDRCHGDTIQYRALAVSVTLDGERVSGAAISVVDPESGALTGSEREIGTFHSSASSRSIICVRRKQMPDYVEIRVRGAKGTTGSAAARFPRRVNIVFVDVPLARSN